MKFVHGPSDSFQIANPCCCLWQPECSHLHHVHLSPHTRHPPPPCLLERKRSFPTSIASNRARTLVSHLRCGHWSLNHSTSTVSIRARTLAICLHHVYLSANARLPLPPCPFKPEHPSPLELERSPSPPPCLLKCKRSFPTSIASNRARMLVSHLCHVHWSPNAPTSTMSIQAQTLAICLHHVYSSANTRLPPPPARTLSIHFHHVYSSANACLPPPPCLFEPERSSSISTTSIRAQLLVSCFLPPSYLFLRFLDRS